MSRLPRPCIDCGEITTNGTRCKRHAKTSARFGSGWNQISQRILKRDGYLCQLQLPGCTGRATTVDHLVRRSEGGTSSPSNLVAACRHCNSSKG